MLTSKILRGIVLILSIIWLPFIFAPVIVPTFIDNDPAIPDVEDMQKHLQNPHVNEFPTDAAIPEELLFLSRPPPISVLVKPEMTPSALPWHNNLIRALRKWEKKFFDLYPNALTVTFLSAEEFTEKFPTAVDLQFLRDEQNQMLTDVVKRVEDLLLYTKSGTREEKLSITKNILSQYWGSNFADLVVKRLRLK